MLEDRIPRARIEDWSQIKGLIVLGGHPSRYLEAFALAEQHPSLRIVISGASDWEMELVATTSARIRARIEFEGKSRIWFKDTYGNALYSKELISPRPGARWLLVTSAVHMPRALGTFQALGFNVEPWPTQDRSKDLSTLMYLAKHEWLGLIGYRLLGRTKEWLPLAATR